MRTDTAVSLHPDDINAQTDIRFWTYNGEPIGHAILSADGDRLTFRVRHDATPDTLAAALRELADRVDNAYRQWLDENAATWGLGDDGRFRDCGGYGEHLDTCPVGQAIAAARHTLARRDLLDASDVEVEYGPADRAPVAS